MVAPALNKYRQPEKKENPEALTGWRGGARQ